MSFYFAWVASTATTFSQTTHGVEDEQIVSFLVSHNEGDFPTLEIEIVNPKTGLLGTSREQWAWLSWDDPDTGDIQPLFFGRLIGIPQELQAETVRLFFIARPTDYQTQKVALAETLKVLPFYDPVWLTEEERNDPDSVLEGYTKLWHIDRLTHTVTVSDIVSGEDGTITYDDTVAMYDGLSISPGQSPARRIEVEARVQWNQAGSGSVDLTPALKAAFKAKQPENITYPNGTETQTADMITLLAGENMIQNWPTTGAAVGSGWSVGFSQIGPAGPKPQPVVVTELQQIEEFAFDPGVPIPMATAEHAAGRGLGPQFGGLSSSLGGASLFTRDVVWLPAWRMAAELHMDWNISRARSETASFTLDANVQALLTDAGEEETLKLTMGPVTVDTLLDPADTDPASAIENPLRSTYFKTDRGISSFEHVALRARAKLIARSRAVTVSTAIPFNEATALTCRENVTLSGDNRIPGSTCTGKVKGYTFRANGNSGELIGTVTIGCTVGYGGTVAASGGTGTYSTGYGEEGYEVFTGGASLIGTASDLLYDDFDDAVLDDDGLNFEAITANSALVDLTITGGYLTEEQDIEVPSLGFRNVKQVVDVLTGVETTVSVEMLPLTGGPFNTVFSVTTYDLEIPQGINLEA